MSAHAQSTLPGDMPGGCDLCREQGGLPGLPSITSQCRCGSVKPTETRSGTVIVRHPDTAPGNSPWVVMSYAEAIYRLRGDGRLDIYTEAEAAAYASTLDWQSIEYYQITNAIKIAWPGGLS